WLQRSTSVAPIGRLRQVSILLRRDAKSGVRVERDENHTPRFNIQCCVEYQVCRHDGLSTALPFLRLATSAPGEGANLGALGYRCTQLGRSIRSFASIEGHPE